MTGTPEATARRPAGEDGSIEAAIRQGDHRLALERCAREHGRSLGRLCMAFAGSQPEAEELVQEILIAAHDAFATYRAEGSLRAWLFGIARRVAARYVETRARRDARLRLVHDASRDVVDAGADDLAIEKERAERARAALMELKPTEREAVLLRYEAGLSFREVGEVCGVDEPTARKRVSRALARLREIVGEET